MKQTFFVGFLCLLFGCMSQSLTEKYRLYSNAKYNFSVEYPADLLIPQPEADMGDGRRFVSADGQTELVAVYEYIDEDKLENSEGKLKAVYKYCLNRYDKKLEFKHLGADYFLLMGRQGKMAYSEKYIIKDGFVCSCTFSYPLEKIEEYREMSKKIFASFQ